MAKYDPLRIFLERQRGNSITMSFEDVAQLVGGLPKSARQYSAWWANDSSGTHPHAIAWMKANWKVEAVNLSKGIVRFTRT